MSKVKYLVENVQMKLLPKPKRNAFLRQRAKKRFDTFVRSQIGDFMVEVDPGPVGDEEIIMRTAVLQNADARMRTNSDQYFRSGYGTMFSWLKHLKQHSFNLRTAQAIMEFGCGSARLIRHLRCIDGIQLVGTDVKPEFVEWCRANIPGIEFHVNELEPPLTFAHDNTFDLVFAQSVFTHIPLAYQSAWIDELYRVIRPGGFLLATVLGRYHQEKMLTPQQMAMVRNHQQVTLDAASPNASVSTQLIGSWDVFQSRHDVLNAFGAKFHVCDYIPRELDLLVLKKPE